MIKDARDQINSRLQKKPPGSRGVIALSMSKAFNPEHNFLLYSEESSTKELLGERLEVEAHRVNETWLNLGKKVIGGLLYVIIVSADAKNDKYALAQQFNFLPLGHSSADRDAFYALCERLQRLPL